jgi:hypothetical protein
MIAFVDGFDPFVAFPAIERVAQLARINDRQKFKSFMVEIIKTTHRMADEDPTLLKAVKRANRLVCELEDVLNEDSNLSRWLVWSDVEAVSHLAERLHKLERLHEGGRPKKWAEIIRKRFVNGLLDATEAAGGRLGLDRPNGRRTLPEAIKLLRPCLPKDAFQRGLSISTLKTIKAERAKKPQKTV